MNEKKVGLLVRKRYDTKVGDALLVIPNTSAGCGGKDLFFCGRLLEPHLNPKNFKVSCCAFSLCLSPMNIREMIIIRRNDGK